MIRFFSENKYTLLNKRKYKKDIQFLLKTENKKVGELNFIFCNDEYLKKINQKYLNHNYYTDIISFNYVENNIVSGDIYISTERVEENSKKEKNNFNTELKRVLFHGVLHLCGYNDKTQKEILIMRKKEEYYLLLTAKCST